MREGARLRLDYSAQSLWRVDRTIEEISRQSAPYAAMETVLRGFGAYAGEVVVRLTGGEWWTTGGAHWVRTPDGRLWDPIEEARRCYQGEGSLRLLLRDAIDGPKERAAGNRPVPGATPHERGDLQSDLQGDRRPVSTPRTQPRV